MEQLGLTPRDLERYIGPSGWVTNPKKALYNRGVASQYLAL
jgi:hypothetical protein